MKPEIVFCYHLSAVCDFHYILPDITTAQATDIDERSVTSSLCCGWLVPVVFLFECWQRPTATQMFTEGGVWFAKMESLMQNTNKVAF